MACIRCGEPALTGETIDDSRFKMYKCAACDYINVAGSDPETLPLDDSLEQAGATAMRDKLAAVRDAGHDEALALLRGSVAALAHAAVQLVAGAPETARRFARQLIWKAEKELARHGGHARGNDMARTASAKAAALIYALTGPLDFDASAPSPDTIADHAMLEDFFAVATNAGSAASVLHFSLRGDTRVAIREGVFTVAETELGLDLAEMICNRRAAGVNGAYEDQQVAYLRMALLAAPGIDLEKITRRFVDPHGRDRIGLVAIDMGTATPADRKSFEAFEFHAERARTFEYPWFFDLGPRRTTPAAADEMALSICMHLWTTYYPVLRGVRNGREIFVVGAQAWSFAFDNLISSKSRVLQDLAARGGGRSIEVKEEGTSISKQLGIADFRRHINSHAERRAARILTEGGWKAIHGQDWNIDGATEEIDVMAVRTGDGHIDLLVAEVKDFDFTLHRISGPTGLTGRMRKAEDQLARKQSRVARSLPAVLLGLGIKEKTKPVHVHALLVTSDAWPAAFRQRFDGADFAQLARFAELVRTNRAHALRMFGRATMTVML
jgi:hypothetical protein